MNFASAHVHEHWHKQMLHVIQFVPRKHGVHEKTANNRLGESESWQMIQVAKI